MLCRTDRLRKGDRIIVPDHYGTIRIPVTVIRVTTDETGECTINYRRDPEQGGRRDYLFADPQEQWPLVNDDAFQQKDAR